LVNQIAAGGIEMKAREDSQDFICNNKMINFKIACKILDSHGLLADWVEAGEPGRVDRNEIDTEVLFVWMGY
jgi:hypothetical protein